MPHAATEKLIELIGEFRSLNPEVGTAIKKDLFSWAKKVPESEISFLLPEVEKILSLYLQSPIKRAIQATLTEYFQYIEQSAAHLLEDTESAPDSSAPPPSPAPPAPRSFALVPREQYAPKQWLRIITHAKVPNDIVQAVDAARNRHELIESVFPPLFKMLHIVHSPTAFQWQLAYCNASETPPDPDLIRDILLSWQDLETLPQPALKQALNWSDNEQILRHWPRIIEEADLLLRHESLTRWLQNTDEQSAALRHLRLLAPFRQPRKITRWYRNSLKLLGECTTFFAVQAEGLKQNKQDNWRRDALFTELQALTRMVPPILILADLHLAQPNGALDFAMAIFGFTEDVRFAWEKELEEQCRYLVRRCFLTDLKRGKKPGDTIHLLCFGDLETENALRRELDLLNEDFDSLSQRELVVKRLATNYASYREYELLTAEISRRFRRMMRVLHEDNLRRLLSPEQFECVEKMEQTLIDLSVLATESRKYLNQRRKLNLPIEDILAADDEFIRQVRQVRSARIHHILKT